MLRHNVISEESCDVTSLTDWSSEDADERFIHRVGMFSSTVRHDELNSIPCSPTKKRRMVQGSQAFQKLIGDLINTEDDFEIQPDSESDENDESSAEAGDVIVRGEDIPVSYTVRGIHQHEFPAIGVYLDSRICPGFKYRVRYSGTDDELFDGKPRLLQSVGRGYGKRLTFQGDRLNNNDCYFWSDSHPNGFAFTIHVGNEGDRFIILDQFLKPLGEAVIESVASPQTEESMEINGSVRKAVRMRATCSVTYSGNTHHGLVDLNAQEVVDVIGLAIAVKSRKTSEAYVESIRDVFLPRLGHCSFYREAP